MNRTQGQSADGAVGKGMPMEWAGKKKKRNSRPGGSVRMFHLTRGRSRELGTQDDSGHSWLCVTVFIPELLSGCFLTFKMKIMILGVWKGRLYTAT